MQHSPGTRPLHPAARATRIALLWACFFGLASAALPAVGAPDASAWQVELLAQHGGALQTVALEANYAYVGMGAGIAVVDISLPSRPVLVGRSVALSGTVQAITVRDRVAYVGVADLTQPASVVEGASGRDVGRLYVFDVADPARPQLRQVVHVAGAVSELRMHENRIYAAAGFAGVCGFDVSIDRQIRPTGCLRLWEPRSFWAAFGVGFPARSLDVNGVGTLVYTAAGGELWILGAQDGRVTSVLSHFTHSPDVVLAVRRFATSVVIIGDEGASLVEPATGATLDSVRIAGPAALEVQGPFAYVVSGRFESRSLIVIDWELPMGNRKAGTVRLKNGTSSATLAASGDIVAVTGGAYSMELVNTCQSVNPVAMGELSGSTTGDLLAVDQGYAYLLDGAQTIRVLDVADPLAPRPVGTLSVPGIRGAVVAMAVYESRGYLAFLTGGIVVLDLSAPSRPTVLSVDLAPDLGIVDTVVAGGRLYVLDQRGELVILDASRADTLTELGRLSLGLPNPVFGGRILVRGALVFVSAGEGSGADPPTAGVRIVGAHDPTSPRVLASFSVDGDARGMAATDEMLYVAGGFAGIHTVDIHTVDVTAPTPPRVTSTTALPGMVNSVLLKDHLLLSGESTAHDIRLGTYVGGGAAVTLFDTMAAAAPTQLSRARASARAVGRLHLLPQAGGPNGSFRLLSLCWQASICVWGVSPSGMPPAPVHRLAYLPFAFRGVRRP